MRLQVEKPVKQSRGVERTAAANALFAKGDAEYLGAFGMENRASLVAGQTLTLGDGRKVTLEDMSALKCSVCGGTHKAERSNLTQLFKNKSTGKWFALSFTCLGSYAKAHAKKIGNWKSAATYL